MFLFFLLVFGYPTYIFTLSYFPWYFRVHSAISLVLPWDLSPEVFPSMASSEIEVVASPNSRSQTNNEVAIVDIYSASAYGDFQKVRSFVEDHGASLLIPDSNGYYALQWAALNNFSDIVQYIIEVFWILFSRLIEMILCLSRMYYFDYVCSLLKFWRFFCFYQHGADVNSCDKLQQTALHWAAVRGSIMAADVLLLNGARVEAADINGYRVTLNI